MGGVVISTIWLSQQETYREKSEEQKRQYENILDIPQPDVTILYATHMKTKQKYPVECLPTFAIKNEIFENLSRFLLFWLHQRFHIVEFWSLGDFCYKFLWAVDSNMISHFSYYLSRILKVYPYQIWYWFLQSFILEQPN